MRSDGRRDGAAPPAEFLGHFGQKRDRPFSRDWRLVGTTPTPSPAAIIEGTSRAIVLPKMVRRSSALFH